MGMKLKSRSIEAVVVVVADCSRRLISSLLGQVALMIALQRKCLSRLHRADSHTHSAILLLETRTKVRKCMGSGGAASAGLLQQGRLSNSSRTLLRTTAFAAVDVAAVAAVLIRHCPLRLSAVPLSLCVIPYLAEETERQCRTGSASIVQRALHPSTSFSRLLFLSFSLPNTPPHPSRR